LAGKNDEGYQESSVKPDELVAQYTKRINELLERLDTVGQNVTIVGTSREFSTFLGKEVRATVDGCHFGTLTIVESLYGANSPQTKALIEGRKALTKAQYTDEYELRSTAQMLKGTLLNVREELAAGLIRKISVEAAGEVIGDLIALSRAQLKAGYKDVAAVLAVAALEDSLKRKADGLGVNVQGKTLDAIINALKAKSFLKGPQAPIVASYVKLRNAAMHADWNQITEVDVSSLLGFLEPFVIQHFS
jgi:hypothetical protein